MNSSNEFNRIDDEKISRNEIKDYLSDIIENIDEENNNNKDERIEMNEMFNYSVIADSGDVIDYQNNTDKNLQLLIKSQLTIRQSSNSLFKHDQFNDNEELIKPLSISEHSIKNFIKEKKIENIDDEKNIILPEKTDFKDLNPYEPSFSQLSINDKSQENEWNINSDEDNQNLTSPLSPYQLSPIDIESSLASTRLVLPQLLQNDINSSNSFQELWSSRSYSPKLIDSNRAESTSSILWLLIILLSKLIIIGLYSFIKILQYDTILFSFCYLLGALIGMNAYFFIDFLLILICIISIFVATYEKWLFYYVNLTDYDHQLNNNQNENHHSKQIKLIAYGLAIGTISSFIV